MASYPNHDTPMAFLPKDLANHIAFIQYVSVSCLAVSLWDFMDNIPCDILLLTRYPVRLPTVSFIFCRIITVAYFFFMTVFMTFPIGQKCYEFGFATNTILAASLAATNFLFLLRVRALYNGNRWVTAVFTALWLSVAASTTAVPWAMPSGNIGPTDYCMPLPPAPYLSAAIITAFVNDTLVFFAITHRLMKMSTDTAVEEHRGVMNRLRIFTSTRSLSFFPRMLLLDNQVYYLVSVVLRGSQSIAYFIPSIPLTYRVVFCMPFILTFHILVCRVFRKTKLGSLHHAGYCDVLITRAPTFGVGLGGVEATRTTRQMGVPLEFHRSDSAHSSTDGEQQTGTEGAPETAPQVTSVKIAGEKEKRTQE